VELTLVQSASEPVRAPRAGIWVKISMSLIVTGMITLATTIAIAVHWYNGLHTLRTAGATRTASISINAGGTQVIDELVTTTRGYRYLVDVRKVSVRLRVNTAGATVAVKTCEAGGGTPGSFALPGGATCTSPLPFRPGALSLPSERLLVQVHAARQGTVVIDGIDVSYRAGIRHATQHVGLTATITVRP